MQSGAYRTPAFPKGHSAPQRLARLAAAGGRGGQALVETCLAMFLICLIFAGFFQVSQVLAAREVLQHAAARGARAQTVGFNRWMVRKCIYAALIPNSGRLREPAFENVNGPLRDMTARLAPGVLWDRLLGITPASAQYNLERTRIPDFLGSENEAQSRAVLDYERWQDRSINYTASAITEGPDGAIVVNGEIEMTVEQELPLTVPLHRAFYAADTVRLRSESWIENHFPLYIDDENR